MQPVSRFHILLAEDNDFNRQLAGAVLDEQGYLVTVASDGEQAVALFCEQAFDMILMDCGMPRMDGYAATRAIRSIERCAGGRIPIIALTATVGPEERRACLDSGMDDVLCKPISIDELKESIARCGQGAAADGLCGGTQAKAPEIRGAPDVSAVTAVDPCAVLSDRVLADFSASPQRLASFFDLLCDDLGTQLAAMNTAYEAGDCAGLRMAAHAAKGVAQGLRDLSLSRLAEEIEHLAQAGDCSGIGEKLSEMGLTYRLLKN